ncbi:unnamed protein product [Phytomonas sp. Hart1]|nr:unnamed protein product [Phytomonas sp. Hart1]|eukprot:CCW66422.1 unnamed protein product [Phytomonas sp. isolate Hart1]
MGGKRKKTNRAPIKKESRYKIPARFDCPLCDVKSSIVVKISRSTGIATVHCRSCQVGKERKWPILPREKGVDVFFRFREELLELDRQYLNNHPLEVNSGKGDFTAKITNLAELSRQEQRRVTLEMSNGNTLGGSKNGSTELRKRHRPTSYEDSRENNNNEDDMMNFFIPPHIDDDDNEDHDSIDEEEQYAAMFQ